MKRLTAYLFSLLLEPLRRYSGPLALLMLLSAAFAQAVEPFSNSIYAFFQDPVLFGGLVLWVSTQIIQFVTDAFKDRNIKMRGWHTRLIAGATAGLLAGVGGFLGFSHFTDLTGLQGALTAASLALMSWLGADFRHRAEQLRKTGMRQEDRRKFSDTVSDTVLNGLIASAKLIPPPFSLLVSEATIRALYESEGAEFVRSLLDRTRALTVEEAEAATEATQKDRQISVGPTGGGA